ncbi:MAG: LysM peptidoglycan-binding domain-containing protein [Clostridia bacterium]|nr:LysM peptidoglycan-binding domain-containing protein [Clostridia bacterium]
MYIKVMEGETAEEIAGRAGYPLCMLLRANGVLSGAWLETMTEVRAPDADECEKSAFPCPNDFARAEILEKVGYIIRKGDTAKSIARAHCLPERIVSAVSKITEGKAIFLPVRPEGMKIHTVKPGETWENFENAFGLKFLNMHFAPLYPGMKILIKGHRNNK